MSFPLFSKLPLELQDLIWTFFILQTFGTAHFVRLKVKNKKASFYGRLKKQKRIYCPADLDLSRPYILNPYAPAYDGIATLLKTTRHSREIAERVRYGYPRISPSNYLVLQSGKGTFPRLCIDATTNLIIPADGAERILNIISPTLAHKIHHSQPGRMRYLAISPTCNRIPHPRLMQSDMKMYNPNLGTSILSLLKAFRKLHVLYALIEPRVLYNYTETQWEKTDWMDVQSYHVQMMGSYIDTYGKDEHTKPPHGGVFRNGRREYYEVPAKQVEGLGGLEWLIEELATATNEFAHWLQGNGWVGEFTKIRLMSWYDEKAHSPSSAHSY
ncbi:hypothetical protein AJ79_10236 [Helicocarpus griseus UAMH5409]|uniref:2EXR domain-containing protein n=1 Tax=Helicocarpus griseus UAMH5409 TaxID=1447875 RepID=A0A2B7WEW1_9EURO|nr:hypothetical protein AJ79_10236 [Helicocarpus griseus UAMH5409]